MPTRSTAAASSPPTGTEGAQRITVHGAAVAEFRHGGGPFVAAVEHTRMPMLFTDAQQADDPVVFANQSFLRLSGHAQEEVLGRRFNRLLVAGQDVSLRQHAASAGSRHEDTCAEAEFRRKDGGSFRAALLVSPVRDAAGGLVQHFVSLVDLTRHHADRDHLRFLLDELNHRNQNLFTTIIEIVRNTLRREGDAPMRGRLITRILALSRAQDLLQTEHAEGVGLRRMLGAMLRPPLMDAATAGRFVLEGADLQVPNHAAVPLALAFHELAANAMARGAPTRAEGRVRISWLVEPGKDGPQLVLRWAESGGPPVTPPDRLGFGLRMVESGLRHGLGGSAQLCFAPSGLVCDMALPLRQPGYQV
jgi:PAS domain S-box-containing protein